MEQPWRWPEIWEVNSQIENPHLIYPGDIIRLSYQEGSPILTVERRGSRTGNVTSGRNVKLSPSIRTQERSDAIQSIPIDVIRQFLTAPLVVAENEMDNWPYIVSSYEQHLVAGPGNEIYINGLDSGSKTQNYSIYRKGPEYRSRSDNTETVLGYEAIYVGEATVKKIGNPSIAVVTHAELEVLNGDRLIVQSSDIVSSDFIPSSPTSQIQGSIISAQDVLSEIGQYQVVVLDRGATEGVEIGNIFGVYQTGREVTDKTTTNSGNRLNNSAFVEYLGKFKSGGTQVTLPEVYAGVAMVFRTFDKVSYALVMEAVSPIHLDDSVRSF